MGAKKTERKNISFFALKAKTSDTDPTPYFGKSTKTGDKWVITEAFDAMDGHLTAIKHSTYTWEGQEKNKLEITLCDPDGAINVVGANFNSLTYTLLNLLASQEKIGRLDISVWLGRANDDGKQFPAISVKNNGVQCKWKYPYETQPKPEKVKFKNKTVIDDTNVVEFWKTVLAEIREKITPFTPTAAAPLAESAEEAVPGNSEVVAAKNQEDDGMPF